jgi:hypothetical protein
MSDSDSDDSEDFDDNYYGREVVNVHGAGLDVVNGEYERNGEFDSVGKYTKTGLWRDQNHEFSLFRCNTSSNYKYWYISIVPMDVQPGTSSDIDFYSAPVSRHDPDFPPEHGWRKSDLGREPAPQVTMMPQKCSIAKYAVPTVSVSEPFANAFQAMLFSENFSDCKFVCADGQVIPAHKCILAASSPYFKAAFGEQWKDTDELRTTHAAHIVKAMLAMFYTGDTSSVFIKEDPFAFMGLASEYNLEWLKKMVEHECARSLDVSRLKDCWCAGRLYDSSYLKNACVEYARWNSLAVLSSSEITRLQTEDPASWKEFSEAISKKKGQERDD